MLYINTSTHNHSFYPQNSQILSQKHTFMQHMVSPDCMVNQFCIDKLVPMSEFSHIIAHLPLSTAPCSIFLRLLYMYIIIQVSSETSWMQSVRPLTWKPTTMLARFQGERNETVMPFFLFLTAVASGFHTGFRVEFPHKGLQRIIMISCE